MDLQMKYDISNWLEEFEKNETNVYISARILGIESDEIEYYNDLYSLSKQKKVIALYDEIIKHDQLNEDVANTLEQMFKQEIDLPSFLNQYYTSELSLELPESKEDNFYQAIFNCIASMWQINNITSEEAVKSFLMYVKNYQYYLQCDIREERSNFIWYGNMNYSQAYFIFLIMLLKFDVIVLSPNGKDYLYNYIPYSSQTSKKVLYDNIFDNEKFPTSRKRKIKTLAQQATQQKMVGEEIGVLYRDWEYKDYLVRSIELETTYNEVARFIKEPGYLRPGFTQKNKIVQIPTLFTKISGQNEEQELIDFITKSKNLENAIVIDNYPFSPEIRANYSKVLKEITDGNGDISVEKILSAPWWKYKTLNQSLQKNIANGFINTINDEYIKADTSESEFEKKWFVLGSLIYIADDFIMQFEKFDFGKQNPKVILLHTDNDTLVTRAESIQMRFLHHLGFDIISINPAGRADIDAYLESEIIQTHRLAKNNFNFTYNFENIKKKKITF